ncbi:MAG TPA: hypothetical protein DCL35_03720 [Candidatus Omnitrophica bacterium]|nr:hypothetical protein [Candidatus Omnitrophota bacterium]
MGNNNLDVILKKKENIVLVVMVLISLWFAKGIYSGQSMRYEEMLRQIETEKEKGVTLDRILVFNEKIKKAKEKSWDTLDTNAIIDKIYKEGIESEIKIRNISPGGRVEEKNYVLISFGIESEATYKQFIRFIKRLEIYPMLVRVKTFNIEPMDETGRSVDPILRGSIALDAVYLK